MSHMDSGHHNCRDYAFMPEGSESKAFKPASTASLLAARAARLSQKSPLNGPSRRPPVFPFLQLPLELRRQIYSYLLPCTEEQQEIRHLFRSITAKRVPPTHTNLPPDVLQKVLAASATTSAGPNKNIIWRRGQTSLLAVCQQFHNECAELFYGESTFVIFITYDSISFRFRWSLPNGLSPNRTYEFLELIPAKYLKLIKRLVVTVDHVDSYTGQIKYNVGGKGLTHGLRSQVARLVQTMKATATSDGTAGADANDVMESHGVKRLTVKLSNGNDHLDNDKKNVVKSREVSIRGVEEVQTVLVPLKELKGLVSLDVTGAVTEPFVEQLKANTMVRAEGVTT